MTLGSICHCFTDEVVANFYTEETSAGGCSSPCAGDPSQRCGGPEALDLYFTPAKPEAVEIISHEEPDSIGKSTAFESAKPGFGSIAAPRLPEANELHLHGSRPKYSCSHISVRPLERRYCIDQSASISHTGLRNIALSLVFFANFA